MAKSELLDKVLGAVVDHGHQLIVQVHVELILDKLDSLVKAGAVLAFIKTLVDTSQKLFINSWQLISKIYNDCTFSSVKCCKNALTVYKLNLCLLPVLRKDKSYLKFSCALKPGLEIPK